MRLQNTALLWDSLTPRMPDNLAKSRDWKFVCLGAIVLAQFLLNTNIMIKRALSDNLGFAIASFAYIISHVIDYLLTAQGIAGNIAKEGNPVIREYISLFGVKGGLLVYKSLICGGVILGMKAIDLLRRRQKTTFRAEYILYGGAILTALGGCLWLLPHDSVIRLFTLLKMVP